MSDKKILSFVNKEDEEKYSTASAMDAFLSSNGKILLTVIVLAVILIVASIAGITISDSVKLKQLGAIDKISYALTQKSSALNDEELDKRRDTALEQLTSYTTKKNVVGVRANMLIGDIQFQKGKFEEAKNAYLAAAQASPKAYTAPIAYYNAAECSENLNDTENAISYYEKAESYSDFMMITHTIFNIGRVKEVAKDFDGAKEAYSKLSENYPDDSWTKIAKSRLLDFEIKGLVK